MLLTRVFLIRSRLSCKYFEIAQLFLTKFKLQEQDINMSKKLIEWKIRWFIKSILKSLVILAIWLALDGAIYLRIAPFFALNRIFFWAN